MAFIDCACGDRHWGPYGAAGLLLTDPARTGVLLQLRSARVLNPGTWALMGGALEPGETPVQGALREAHEEAGIDLSTITPIETLPGLTHPQWRYTYVLAETPELHVPDHDSWEVVRHEVVPLDQVLATGSLHPDLARDWPRLMERLQVPVGS